MKNMKWLWRANDLMETFAPFLMAGLTVVIMVYAMSSHNTPTNVEAATDIRSNFVREIFLSDGTRCAAIGTDAAWRGYPREGLGITCDWQGHKAVQK